jgi:NitT/TauT family transport system permease protein
LVFIVGLWYTLATYVYDERILPAPQKMINALIKSYKSGELTTYTWFSIKLNLIGYLYAVIVAVPLGFILGLFPIFKTIASRYLDAIRFLPFTALTGLFIGWFGIELKMKTLFLAGSILVYLLPTVVVRISEVPAYYLQIATTLGANRWQTVQFLILRNVLASVWNDIRILVAISWTYIIVAEGVNMQGGVGMLIATAIRQSNQPLMFGILFIIIGIGFLQDKIFVFLDRIFFPFKYEKFSKQGAQMLRTIILLAAVVILLLGIWHGLGYILLAAFGFFIWYRLTKQNPPQPPASK